MKPYKIIVVNTCENQTEVLYFRNDGLVLSGKTEHCKEELNKFGSAAEQYEIRKKAVLEYLAKYGIRLSELDAIASTGNLTTCLFEHACWISEEMALEAKYGRNCSDVRNVGIRIAYNLCNGSDHAVALTAKTDFGHGNEMMVLGEKAFEKLCEQNSCYKEQIEKIC